MGINKEITKCIIEIITLIFIVIFTYPVLHMIGESEGAKIAEYYDNYEASDVTLYYEKKADLNNLYPVTNEYALNNLDYSIINVINNTKENKKYNLMLIVEKNSTLDTNYLMININGKTLKLSDCYYTENKYITYYLIDSNTIKTNSSKKKYLSTLLLEKNYCFKNNLENEWKKAFEKYNNIILET